MPQATANTSGCTEKVLVVGGTGRLGGLLRLAWARRGREGLIWQSRRGGGDAVFDPLSDPVGYAQAATGADVIINLAGTTGGDSAVLAQNRDLALAAVAAAQAAGVPHIFLSSSAAVYGRGLTGTHEDAEVAPVSPYGRAKRDMEEAVLDRAVALGVTCLRIGNVAGADQLLAQQHSDGPQMLDICADGRGPRRSYVGPQALAAMIDRMIGAVRAGRRLPDRLNVALEGAVSMDSLLEADGRFWAPRPAQAMTIADLCLDTTLLGRVIGRPERADAGAIVADLRELMPREHVRPTGLRSRA